MDFELSFAILAISAWIILVEVRMAKSKQEFLDAIDGIGSSIEDIRADIQTLKDKIAAGGLTADEEAEVAAALDAKLAAAKALADENQ